MASVFFLHLTKDSLKIVMPETYAQLGSHRVRPGTKPDGAAQHQQPGQLLISSGQEHLLTNTRRRIWKGREEGIWRGERRVGAQKAGGTTLRMAVPVCTSACASAGLELVLKLF